MLYRERSKDLSSLLFLPSVYPLPYQSIKRSEARDEFATKRWKSNFQCVALEGQKRSASYAFCAFCSSLWRIQSAQRRSISRNAAIDYHGPAYRYYRTYTYNQGQPAPSFTPNTRPFFLIWSARECALTHAIPNANRALMTSPPIILVPRISPARYCHQQRLMFHRSYLDCSIATAVKFPVSQKLNPD